CRSGGWPRCRARPAGYGRSGGRDAGSGFPSASPGVGSRTDTAARRSALPRGGGRPYPESAGAPMTQAAETPYRHPRRGLVWPFVVVGLLLAVWTGWWFYLARQVESRLAAGAE